MGSMIELFAEKDINLTGMTQDQIRETLKVLGFSDLAKDDTFVTSLEKAATAIDELTAEIRLNTETNELFTT